MENEEFLKKKKQGSKKLLKDFEQRKIQELEPYGVIGRSQM